MHRKELLSYEEMERLIRIFAGLGVSKVRITGGEPFARRDLMPFLKIITQIEGIRDLHITTNGTLTHDKVGEMEQLGIRSVNLSLDTLDRNRFLKITRRDDFAKVIKTLELLLETNMDVKINMVVMDGLNTEDIIPMIELSRDRNLSVRFIEQMPFNETGDTSATFWDMFRIKGYISEHYHGIHKLKDSANSTSMNYSIPGFKGNFGIIAAYTRTFCGTCNRLRLTPKGELQTCLYADPTLNLRDLLRAGNSDLEIAAAIENAVSKRHKDGFEAEKAHKSDENWRSMAKIGG